jgi:hypothetical protein
MRKITYDGKTLTLAEWSRATGIPSPSIHRRISEGWDLKRVLTEPAKKDHSTNKDWSKNDAELELNDTQKEALPKELKPLIENYHGSHKKYGKYVREKHREAFNRWYEAELARRKAAGI